jgi:hypothetical protein
MMNTHASSRLRHVASGISIAALIALVPAATMAQSSNGGAKLDPTKADELHQKADQLLGTHQVNRWREVARLLEDAAALRPYEDPAAVEELALAGEMNHYIGRMSSAQKDLETAAEQALKNGYVLRSAHLFLKAAFVAQERGGRDAEVLALAQSAKQLAASPHLSADECDCILAQLDLGKKAMKVSGSRK